MDLGHHRCGATAMEFAGDCVCNGSLLRQPCRWPAGVIACLFREELSSLPGLAPWYCPPIGLHRGCTDVALLCGYEQYPCQASKKALV